MAPLKLIANLATIWHHLHQLKIWPPDGATYISCKICHQMAPLALVTKLATDGATYISCKFGHVIVITGTSLDCMCHELSESLS